MRVLRFIFFFILMIFATSCAGINGKDLFKSKNISKPPPTAFTQKTLIDREPFNLQEFLQKHRYQMVLLTLLLLLFAIYDIRKQLKPEKPFKFTDIEISTIGHIADLSNDIIHSIKSRTKRKVTSFLRRD